MEFLILSVIVGTLIPVAMGWVVLMLSMVMFPFLSLVYAVALNFSRPEVSAEEKQPGYVLVVDDDYESVIPLLAMLEQERVPFKYIPDSLQAVKELAAAPFRLIFMDLEMPELKGDEALARADQLIGTNKQNSQVILYTGTNLRLMPHSLKHFAVVGLWRKSMNLLLLKSQLNDLLWKNQFPGAAHT
jgi:CheY-like chemotaxis protein